jgi:hypothetical protein
MAYLESLAVTLFTALSISAGSVFSSAVQNEDKAIYGILQASVTFATSAASGAVVIDVLTSSDNVNYDTKAESDYSFSLNPSDMDDAFLLRRTFGFNLQGIKYMKAQVANNDSSAVALTLKHVKATI